MCVWRLLYTNLPTKEISRGFLGVCERAMVRARPSPWRSWTIAGAPRLPRDRYQDGGHGRGRSEPQPRRRLCNGGSSLSRSPMREVNVLRGSCPPPIPLPSLSSHLLLHSLFSRPLSLSSFFFSRGLVFILATTGRMPGEASEGYEARRSEQVRYRLTWNLISARCHRPRVGKQRSPRRFLSLPSVFNSDPQEWYSGSPINKWDVLSSAKYLLRQSFTRFSLFFRAIRWKIRSTEFDNWKKSRLLYLFIPLLITNASGRTILHRNLYLCNLVASSILTLNCDHFHHRRQSMPAKKYIDVVTYTWSLHVSDPSKINHTIFPRLHFTKETRSFSL